MNEVSHQPKLLSPLRTLLSPTMHWPLIGLVLALFIPATGKLQRYFGGGAILLYAVYFALTLHLILRYVAPRFRRLVSERVALFLFFALMVGLGVAFGLIYPIATSGAWGGGNDRDEALTVAGQELLHGHYPYYRTTSADGTIHPLGVHANPISPLPGSILLTLPFTLLGNSAYQNFFWLPLFFFFLRRFFRNGVEALLFLGALFVLTPIPFHVMVTGDDLMANSIWVMLGMMGVVQVAPDPGRSWPVKASVALFFGIGLASRVNFLFLLPLVYAALVFRIGWVRSLAWTGAVGAIFLAVSLPFYLYDPAGFTPLQASAKLSRLESVLPGAVVVIPALTGLAAMALAFRRTNAQPEGLLRNAALVQAVPVVAAVILDSMRTGGLSCAYFEWYGLFFMLFGAVGSWRVFSAGSPSSRHLPGSPR